MERETIWSTRRKNYLETAGTAGTAGEEDATHSVASQHERERSTRRRDEACRTAQRRLSRCVFVEQSGESTRRWERLAARLVAAVARPKDDAIVDDDVVVSGRTRPRRNATRVLATATSAASIPCSRTNPKCLVDVEGTGETGSRSHQPASASHTGTPRIPRSRARPCDRATLLSHLLSCPFFARDDVVAAAHDLRFRMEIRTEDYWCSWAN